MHLLYPIADLKPDTLKAVQDLEGEIGSPVVALSTIDATSAKLSKDQINKLQALESELNVVLIAVRA